MFPSQMNGMAHQWKGFDIFSMPVGSMSKSEWPALWHRWCKISDLSCFLSLSLFLSLSPSLPPPLTHTLFAFVRFMDWQSRLYTIA